MARASARQRDAAPAKAPAPAPGPKPKPAPKKGKGRARRLLVLLVLAGGIGAFFLLPFGRARLTAFERAQAWLGLGALAPPTPQAQPPGIVVDPKGRQAPPMDEVSEDDERALQRILRERQSAPASRPPR